MEYGGMSLRAKSAFSVASSPSLRQAESCCLKVFETRACLSKARVIVQTRLYSYLLYRMKCSVMNAAV